MNNMQKVWYKTWPVWLGISSVVTGLLSLWVIYISPLPMGLAIYGLIMSKHQRDQGQPSKEALILNFIGFALGAAALVILAFVLIASLATAFLPNP